MIIGRTDVEAETPVLWPPHEKSWITGKDPDAGRDWGQEEKGPTEDEMVGWHHWFNVHGFGWTLGVGDAQGGLACCDSWGRKESDTTEWLNWTELSFLNYEYFLWFSNKVKPNSLSIQDSYHLTRKVFFLMFQQVRHDLIISQKSIIGSHFWLNKFL